MERTANCAQMKTDSERVVLHMVLYEILILFNFFICYCCGAKCVRKFPVQLKLTNLLEIQPYERTDNTHNETEPHVHFYLTENRLKLRIT